MFILTGNLLNDLIFADELIKFMIVKQTKFRYY